MLRAAARDEDDVCELALSTNHLDFDVTTIAGTYRECWQIKLFFRALKQNLKFKTLVGTSGNALRIQVWPALLALLLLRYLCFLIPGLEAVLEPRFGAPAQPLHLRDLNDWLKDPFETPPQTSLPEQFALSFA